MWHGELDSTLLCFGCGWYGAAGERLLWRVVITMDNVNTRAFAPWVHIWTRSTNVQESLFPSHRRCLKPQIQTQGSASPTG